jgi:hypothetical protein
MGRSGRRPTCPPRRPNTTSSRSRRSTTPGTSCPRPLPAPASRGGSGASSGEPSRRIWNGSWRSTRAGRSHQPECRRAPRSGPRGHGRTRHTPRALRRPGGLHSRLMALLQQITPYVDTKDREVAGRTLVLNASISALADSAARRGESAAARLERLEQQLDVRASALERGQQDLQTAVAVSHRAVDRAPGARTHRSGPSRGGPETPVPEAAAPGEAFGRTARRVQVRRLRRPVPRLRGGDPRAARELPAAVRRRSRRARRRLRPWRVHRPAPRPRHPARGIDLNPEMVEVCRARGLDVTHADAVALSGRARRRLARRAVRRPGRRAPRAGLSPPLPRALVRQAAARCAARARDAQPGLLGGVLRELHPRHHARAAAAPRDAEVSRAGQRLPAASLEYRSPVPEGIGCSRAPETAPCRSSTDLVEICQRERRQAERPAVHASRLRGCREQAGGRPRRAAVPMRPGRSCRRSHASAAHCPAS